MRPVIVLGVMVCVLSGGRAHAQSTYVGASVIADVVRAPRTSLGDATGTGETLGGALRLGTGLGERFGVELEFARTGEIDAAPPVTILGQSFVFDPDGVFPQIFPPPQIESERQMTTLTTLLWWNHEVSSSLSLAYLGGVAFTRIASEFRITYPTIPAFPPNVIGATRLPRSFAQDSVAYDADVVVGFEGRIRMTEHVRLVPGVRLQTAAGGWAFRPGVGLQWVF